MHDASHEAKIFPSCGRLVQQYVFGPLELFTVQRLLRSARKSYGRLLAGDGGGFGTPLHVKSVSDVRMTKKPRTPGAEFLCSGGQENSRAQVAAAPVARLFFE